MMGRLLSQRYRLVAPLGGGGMALVFLAEDEVLQRQVAVKTLRPELATDDDFVQRFQAEANAAASLSHPNIVTIYDVGQDNGLDYIVMEYIKGQTLKEYIQEQGALAATEAVDIAVQTLQALEHAHEHGVVHRDIKPQNILLTKTGQVKVADFGIARAVGSQTVVDAGPVMGSAHYVSPEQASGRPTSLKTDLYSTGVVLFEMLTGQLPFDGDSAVTVALKHLQEQPPPPKQMNPQVSPTLNDIVLRALAKNPQERYPQAAVMQADLMAYRNLAPADVWAPADDGQTVDLSALPPQKLAHTERAGPAAQTDESHVKITPARHRRQRQREQQKVWRVLLLWLFALVAVGALAGFAAQAVGAWLKPPVVTVPDVQGLAHGVARADLDAVGIELRVVAERNDDTLAAGQVLEQRPKGGQSVRRGSKVDVVLSLGPRLVPGGMVDLRGETETAAELKLTQLGLPFTVNYVHSNSVPEGRVIEHEPGPATPVTAGTSINLVVSNGPQDGPLELPDLRGMTVSAARAELNRLNLRVGEIRPVPSSYPPEQVVQHEPAAGAKVNRGDKVNLDVSHGSSEEEQRLLYKISLPVEPAEQLVEVWVADQRGEHLVHHDVYTGGDEPEIELRWYGSQAEITVVAGGKIIIQEAIP